MAAEILSIDAALHEAPLFSGLPDDAMQFLREHATSRHIAAGELLFRHGDRAESFYLIVSGNVALEIAAIAGPVLELQRLGVGEILGWSWLVPPYRWSFNATTTAPTVVIEFDGVAILAHCEENPRFGYELIKRFSTLMSERLHFARQKMMDEWQPAGFA